MTFLNPIWLFALPLVLIPILIHLLNQRRHRSVDWGAMRPCKTEYALRLLVVMAMTLCFGSSALLAQDDETTAKEEPKKKPDVEMLECNVKVVDPDGHPVEDAVVYCTGLRSKEEQGTLWGWRDAKWGEVRKIKSDPAGIAKIPYPKMLDYKNTTRKMILKVDHPDFVSYYRDHAVDDDPAKVELERGFRIAVTAVDDAGKKITQRLHAVGSFAGGSKWEIKKNGTLVSNVMKKQDGILRVVCFRENKTTLFSDEIEIKPGDKSRVLLKDIQLSQGCRVVGRIDDSVTRPIENGYVIAGIRKKPDPNDWRSNWHWSDEARITREGTFVFESLPVNEVIQMIPICDGWVPAKTRVKDVLALLPTVDPVRIKGLIKSSTSTPQLVKTGEIETAANLSMVKAVTITVKVVDKNGDSLEGISANSSPNQHWFNSGSQILGTSCSSRRVWELQQQGIDLASYFKSNRPKNYFGETDKEGVMHLKNMPPGWQRVFAYCDDLEMRKDPESERQEKLVKVGSKDLEITIKLFPKGSVQKE